MQVPSLTYKQHMNMSGYNIGTIMQQPELKPFNKVSGSQEYAPAQYRRHWFAMSAPYQREMKAKAELEKHSIPCFVPMRMSAVRHRTGKISKELVPAVHNLVFVHSTRELLQQVKQTIPFIQYLTRPYSGKNIPITVPDKEMQQFISVTESYNERLIFLTPEEVHLEKGTPVRIIGGPFDGIEGTFVKVKGCRNRRVVIMARNILGLALDVHPDLIQVLQK